MENEPEENLADNFEHWPNEPATRNDIRTLATLVDRRFNNVDLQFQLMRTMYKEELLEFKESLRKDMSDFRESMRKDMFKFAGFLTVSVLSAISVFGAFVR